MSDKPQLLSSPLTSDVEYTDAECEYAMAMEAYIRINRRPYPTHREALAVAKALGYRKTAQPKPLPRFVRHRNGRGE